MFSEMRLFKAVSAFAGKKPRPVLVGAPALLFLTACAVGPDFQKPAPPPVAGYAAAPDADHQAVAGRGQAAMPNAFLRAATLPATGGPCSIPSR